MSRLGRNQPVQPQAWHGFVDPGPGPVGTVPPRITVVPLTDERLRQRPALPQVLLSGALLPVVTTTVFPPGALIVPIFDERRRLRGPLAPTTSHGFVDSAVGVPGTTPPEPVNVDRADQRARAATPTPITVGAILAASAQAQTVTPPGPYVVPIAERRRLLAAIAYSHGYVDSGVGVPGTTPPPPLILDRVDQRVRYLPLPPLVSISGTYAATVPVVVTPAATGFDQDFVPIIAGW